MNMHSPPAVWYPFLLIVVLFAAAPAILAIRNYLKVTFSGAIGLFLLGSLVGAAVIATTAWRGFGSSFFGVLILGLAALVAYPLLRSLGSQPGLAPSAAPPVPDPSLSSERDRVLRMIENGAIQPDEGAELLAALGESVPAGARVANTRPPLGMKQRLALAGVVLVFIGFVLPWFSIHLGKEMQHLAGQLGAQLPFPELPAEMTGQLHTLAGSFQGSPMRVTGADVHNGLGWIILFMATGIALLSTVPSIAEAATRRLLSVGAFLIGTALLVYIAFNGFRSISLGLPVVIGGYACLALSLFRHQTGNPAFAHSASEQNA